VCAASAACLQVAACAALTNIPYIERVRDALLSERARLFEQLQQVSWLEPYPSQANFILCKVLEVRAHAAAWYSRGTQLTGTVTVLSRNTHQAAAI
jgi:histidinol-phosphate aminotransferase